MRPVNLHSLTIRHCFSNLCRGLTVKYFLWMALKRSMESLRSDMKMAPVQSSMTLPGLLRQEETIRYTRIVKAVSAFYKRIHFYTPAPRWDDWSARDIKFMCSGKKELKFVSVSGRVRFISGRKYSGTHAVINCGIGSCNCKSFTDLTLSRVIEDLEPYMFIAEAHTINDWLSGKTVAEYKEHLGAMLDIMRENAEHTVMMTVSPILGEQMRSGYEIYNTVDYYDNYVEASKEVAAEKNFTMIDANGEFARILEGLSEEELREQMYLDNWHVNSKGHKVYAEQIIGKIEGLL